MAVTKTIQDQVTELYVGFFGRAPDAAGMGYWAERLGAGTATVYSIANEFSKTPEFVSNYGALTPSEQIDKIYVNVLNRKPDADGKAYWLAELTKGTPIGTVVYNVVNAAFSQVDTADGLLVQNKVKVGEYFSLVLASNDTAVAKTAYNGVTSVASTVEAKEIELAKAVAQNYTLTTDIETVPASGTLPLYAEVKGVINGANSTFQTGDEINGTVGGKNVINLTETNNDFAGTTVAVKNVDLINHSNVSGAFVAIDETLYQNVARENLVKGTAGSFLNLTNASASTTFGVSSGVADFLNVDFGTATGVAANLVLAGAGLNNTARHTTTLGTGTQVTGVTVATAGNNFVNLASGGPSLRTVTINGAGTNNITLQNGSISATAAVVIDASAATGNQVIDLGTNASAAGVTVKGTTGASTTTLGLQLNGGAVTLPTITDVDALQLDTFSNGTLIAANSTIKTLVIQPGAAINTLVGLTGVNAIQYMTLGGAVAVNNYGNLTTTANGATTITFAKQDAPAISGANVVGLGVQTLNGATSVAIDTAGAVSATGAANLGTVTSNTLGALTVKSASTGLHTLTVDATNAAATGGVLTSVDLSGIAGRATLTVDANGGRSLAAGALLTGSALGSTFNFAADQVVAFNMSLTGNNTVNGGGQSGNMIVTSNDVAGNANNIATGNGYDLVTLGLGANTVNTGTAVVGGVNGSDLVTINALSTAVNTFNVTTNNSQTSYTGLNGDNVVIYTGLAGTNITTIQNLGTHTTANNITIGGALVGGGASAITASVNNVIATDVFTVNNLNGSVTLSTTGVGGSTYTVTGDGAGANTFALTLNTVGGTDTVSYAAADTATITISNSNLTIVGSGARVQTIVDTVNGGTITLDATGSTDIVRVVANAANASVYDIVVNTGTLDVIDFQGNGNAVMAVNNTGITYASVAAGIAAQTAGILANQAVTFNVGANTIIWAATSAGGVAANDTIIELTGIHTIAGTGAAAGTVSVV